jgi:hypothetical protein
MEHRMPTIIVQTAAAAPDGSGAPATLSERVIAANLESRHYAAQLVERLTWAVRDAEAMESALSAADPAAIDLARSA